MKVKVIYRDILYSLIYLVSLQAVAQTTEQTSRQAAELLSALLAETASMQALVSYLELDQSGRLLDEKKVRLLLRKPDHLSWHILEPYEQLLVTNGDKLWTWEPDLDQVQIDPFPDDVSQNPVLMLSADADTLLDRFDISKSSAGEFDRFILYSRAADAQFTQLSLTFDQSVMTEMHMEGTYGEKVSFIFSDVELNIELDDGLFELEIPEGADIIDTTVSGE